MNNIKDYLTIKQASELLGVDKTTLRRWDKAGKLNPYRHPINKYRLYKKSDIENILNTKKEKLLKVDEIKKYLELEDKKTLISKLVIEINNHCFFKTIDSAHKNNKNNQLATNNKLLADFIRDGYTYKQIIFISTLLDNRQDVISIPKIIRSLKAIQQYDNAKLDSFIDELNNSQDIKQIKKDRNKLIAHLDTNYLDLNYKSTVKNIEEALILIAHILYEIKYMITDTIQFFCYAYEPRGLFKCLQYPFFFPEEIDKLHSDFYQLQELLDKKIRGEVND